MRGSRGGSAASRWTRSSASATCPIMNSAWASGARGSTEEGPPSASACRKSRAAAAGSPASSHCSPARMKASARVMAPVWVPEVASMVIRWAAARWSPVQAASNSISSKASRLSTLT